jgi:hypothetical protein
LNQLIKENIAGALASFLKFLEHVFSLSPTHYLQGSGPLTEIK